MDEGQGIKNDPKKIIIFEKRLHHALRFKRVELVVCFGNDEVL